MANHDMLKSMLVSLGQLTLRIRDHLSESFDQDTYINLLEEVKQSITDIESLTATLSKEAETVDGEVYIIVSDARNWQIKLMSRIHFLESLNVNVNNSVSSSNVIKMKPGRLPEVKLVGELENLSVKKAKKLLPKIMICNVSTEERKENLVHTMIQRNEYLQSIDDVTKKK